PELFKAGRRRQSEALLPLFEAGGAAKQAGGAPSVEQGAPGVPRVPSAAPIRPSERNPRCGFGQRPRRFRRLEDFVVGSCNRAAHAAAIDRAERPEEGPSPLVLHGTVGTGKTHLLEGIYQGLRQSRPDWRLIFVSAEEFTNRFVQAMHQGKLGGFRKLFRDC